ncbi:MAG: HAD family hydrolase, partial [Thermoproteota archaeon]
MSRRSAKSDLQIKAVLFDLDETLIDAAKGLRAAHANVSRKLCLFMKNVKIAKVLREIAKLDDEMNRLRRYDRDLWWQKLVDRLGFRIKLSTPIIKELTKTYWKSYAKAARPYPDAKEVLQYLRRKGYLLGIVTDTDVAPGIKRRRIRELPFVDLFDVVVIAGEDTKHTKPDPGAFILAAKKLGISRSSYIFVGDKPFTDIKGAKSAGMKTILVNRREWPSNVKANFTIKTLTQIKE